MILRNDLNPSDELKEEIRKLELSIVEKNQPLVFRDDSKDNYIVNAEKLFYKSIKILNDNGHNIDLNVTMYEYRVAIEYNEEKIKLMRSKQAQNT